MGRGHKKIRRKRKLRKSLKVFGWIALVAFIGWAFWFGANIGPGKPIEGPVTEVASVSAGELVEKSRELQTRFEAIAEERTPAADDLDILREAIAFQREHNRTGRPTHEDRRRLDEMEERLSHFLAARLREQSDAAEERAAALRGEGNSEAAAVEYARAHELQREINQRHSRSRFRDTPRENRLEQMQVVLRIEPLSDRSREREDEGRRALIDERWNDARRYLTEARDIQVEINETARRTRFYDAGRVTGLNNRIQEIEIGEMAGEVRNLREEAAALAAGNQFNRAAELLSSALSTQQRINRQHPQSRFASTPLAAELDIELQTARSAEGAGQLAERVGRLREALASGHIVAARVEIAPAKRLAEQLFDRYPRSMHVDSELRIELEYLAIVEPGLEQMNRALREDLLDIPGIDGWKMLRTEVPQRLYQSVMNANPSRNRGPDFPVDSVTLQQAVDFCRRASWILGRPVQLITREKFTAALGEWDPADAAEWVAAEGEVREVLAGEPNSHGFYHLVGNLGQWLQPGAIENGRGWIAGGPIQILDGEGNLFREVDRSERSSRIGFRYAVHGGPH